MRFWTYLKSHRYAALVLALFTAVFALVLWLYNVSTEAGGAHGGAGEPARVGRVPAGGGEP